MANPFFPALQPITDALLPWAEAALRLFAGFAFVPHGLQKWFGLFAGTRIPSNMKSMSAKLAGDGYRPGLFWAVLIAATELVAGPLLGLGLFTRLAALPIVVFMAAAVFEHGRHDGYFWTERGLEYPLMWTLVAFYFLVRGGGDISLDHLFGLAAF